ncbi:Phosphoadenosine phosphosulfate reductase [Penicillium sp. DV-2018c]|nr:Phosphoadenosine phosphosulfate reductase [Penicillium sp. DV-2018c]KAJ5560804.1 Phosphoadenosine phosphosulfate reductase [Penicillium sp. DV-2018c]
MTAPAPTTPLNKTHPPKPEDHLRPFPPLSSEPDSSDATSQNGTTANPEDEHTSKIPALPIVIARIHARVQAFLSESHPPDSLLASVQRQTRISLDVVHTALQRYKLSELSVSYNGGKDCLVLLIIFLAGLHPRRTHTHNDSQSNENDTPPSPAEREAEAQIAAATFIPAIYALPPDPFDAVEDFVVTSAEAYHLSLTKYTTAPPASTLRSSFEDYLARHPGVRAIFVGTRRTDPHGARLTHFDRTDGGWPDFMRVHPVIDWHYAEIWAFIRHLDLRYCSLYDEGYTSLGGTSDTHPNPRLRREAAQTDEQYLPAYQLTEDVEERLGRN